MPTNTNKLYSAFWKTKELYDFASTDKTASNAELGLKIGAAQACHNAGFITRTTNPPAWARFSFVHHFMTLYRLQGLCNIP
jgi:hypothetical protein